MKRFICMILCLYLALLSGCNIEESRKKLIGPSEQRQEVKRGTEVLEQVVEGDDSEEEVKISSKDFFDNITRKVRRDWELDAKIYRIHTTILASEIKKLTEQGSCMWEINYVSSSRKKMITASLPMINSSTFDTSRILYTYKNTKTNHSGKAFIDLIKNSLENTMYEEDIANSSIPHILSDEWFTEWKTDFEYISEAAFERLKGLSIPKNAVIDINLYHTDKWKGLSFNAPIWEISWADSRGKSRYFIVNARTGEPLADMMSDEVKKK